MFKNVSFIILLCLIVVQLKAQEANYQTIPRDFQANIKVSVKGLNNFTDLTNYLPKEYVEDASKDYTSFIQRGINENLKIVLPNFPVLINDNGLILRDNSEVYFQEYSKIILKTSNKRKYQVLAIHNKNNVIVYNPKIEGDRYRHDGNKGEWGMGISILGSRNISIFNPYIIRCWGDGIYIGHSETHSKNINIRGGVIDENRRNGISVTSVDNLLIQDILIANTKGTNPQTGIDIEPNNSNNEINNIKITNVITYNNFNNGMLIHLDKLPGKVQKEVKIKVKDFRDIDSRRAVKVSGTYKGDKTKNRKLKGEILFENLNANGSKTPSLFDKNDFFPSIKVKK